VANNSIPPPLDKGKGVLVVPSDDEGLGEGQVFKKRRTNRVISSRSASPQRGGSLRDNPPSATSPSHQLGQEEGGESAPPSTQAPVAQATALETLKIPPPPIMQLMRGFNERSSGSSSGEAKKEGMPYYMGAFLAIALDWRAQAKSKAIEMQALQALKRALASLKEEKMKLEDAYKASLEETRKAEVVANMKLHEAEQKCAGLLGSMIPLQTEVAKLKKAAENFKALEDRCVSQEAKLVETEGELAAKIEALNLLQAENGTLQANVSKLQVEKEFLDKQLVTQNSKIEELEKSNQELLDDMAGTFDEGFKEALAQVTCENPGIDTSNCDPGNQIVDGKVVPLDLGE